MFSKVVRNLKSLSRRTKLLAVEVSIFCVIAASAVATACHGECSHLVREEVCKGLVGGLLVGLLLALHKLATA